MDPPSLQVGDFAQRGLVDDAAMGFCMMSQPEVRSATAELTAAVAAYLACIDAAGENAGSACQDEWEWVDRAQEELNDALQDAYNACKIEIHLPF